MHTTQNALILPFICTLVAPFRPCSFQREPQQSRGNGRGLKETAGLFVLILFNLIQSRGNGFELRYVQWLFYNI